MKQVRMATRGKSSLIWNTGEPADQLVSCFAIKLMKQGNSEGWLGMTLSSVKQKSKIAK
uniref:Uncharacterized protein n=1 Tax=Triticum urartu TaxID=4572 RepID=A0A8R7U6F3_TRIUA